MDFVSNDQQADYTLNFVESNRNLEGWQDFWFSPAVNMTQIGEDFHNRPDLVDQQAGTVGLHELVHKITGIGDLKYNGPVNGTPNLMQVDSYADQYGKNRETAAEAAAKEVSPTGFLLTSEQIGKLLKKCKRPGPGGKGGGSGIIIDIDEPIPITRGVGENGVEIVGWWFPNVHPSPENPN